jgi:hypothetical protein
LELMAGDKSDVDAFGHDDADTACCFTAHRWPPSALGSITN